MQSPVSSPTAKYTYTLPSEDEEMSDMEASVMAVEKILKYSFKNKKLLEEALTHSSCTGSSSYQRLEFVGDAALGLALANYVFLQYPDLDPGKLSLVRAANISTEKLARVAVRHQLYKYVRHNATALEEKLFKYVRHNATALEEKVREFVMSVEQEDEAEIYGGLVKAPKVLADIVESVAAAVYVDCNFDLQSMWLIISNLLKPIVMLDVLEQQPQPVTMLFELCQKYGKKVEIKHSRKGESEIIASVYVNGLLIASASSEQKENAKLHAAKAALCKLSYESGDIMNADIFSQLNGDNEIEGAKRELHRLCDKKKWPRPNYKIQEEVGPAHEKRYNIESGYCIPSSEITNASV
ncbi:Ribonuclease 3-like protein 2 [Sesamum angolense]|uniref:Ribonuclease 3-like protein 2 n=1 Tax=Sesamum angolense TaxID=2727404 RepID=A0AAE1WSI1_9LAMI|nr:Ribonuclease 3-like protein 2 [Sesamum angolense]